MSNAPKRPTQPDMNDSVWLNTPLSIQMWMDDADEYITAIEQEKERLLTAAKAAWLSHPPVTPEMAALGEVLRSLGALPVAELGPDAALEEATNDRE